MTDAELTELYAKAKAAQKLPSYNEALFNTEQRLAKSAYEIASCPAAVLALIDEVRRPASEKALLERVGELGREENQRLRDRITAAQMTPITIAGETLEARDFPIGVDWFDADGTWQHPNDGARGVFVIETRFHPDNLYCAVFWLCDNAPECNLREEHRKLMPWIAARCSRYFLDKAAECLKEAAVFETDKSGKKWDCYVGDVHGTFGSDAHTRWASAHCYRRAYLASADKWARIGRGVSK